jgi:hypothetical protein
VYQGGKAKGNGAHKEETAEDFARAEEVAKRAGNETDEEPWEGCQGRWRTDRKGACTYVAHRDTMLELATSVGDR